MHGCVVVFDMMLWHHVRFVLFISLAVFSCAGGWVCLRAR